jgi:hypothetical protein
MEFSCVAMLAFVYIRSCISMKISGAIIISEVSSENIKDTEDTEALFLEGLHEYCTSQQEW